MRRVAFVLCGRCGRKIEWLDYNKHIEKERKDAEKDVKEYIKNEKLFTVRELVEYTKLPQTQVYKILEKLSSEGIIERVAVGLWKVCET